MIWLFAPFLPKIAGDEVKKVIDSGMINRGKVAEEFEKLLREKYGFFLVHTVNSCTSALRLSLLAAGVKPGDEVLSTPWSMIATNTAILECGAKPIFVDIEYDSLNMDPMKIEERIKERTKAIMVVHYAGYPANMAAIYKIAHQRGLEVIQDCAHAMGAQHRGRNIGAFGKYCCFSFQAIKTITMGDGGAISTTDEDVYNDVVKRSWFGIDKKLRVKTPYGAFPTEIDTLGFKNNITDIDAALGLVGLKNIDYALNKRRGIAEEYNEEFQDLDKVKLPVYAPFNQSAWWLYPIHVKDRDSFAKFMGDNQIQVDKHNERNDKYKIFGGIDPSLEITRRVDEDIIHIPLHASLTPEEVAFIIKKVKEWDKIA